MEENKDTTERVPESESLFEMPVAASATPDAVPEAAGSGMESLTRMARVLFSCLRVVIVLVLVYLLVSGVFRVDEQNEAMLFRFGALQTRVIDPEQGETAILTSGRWYWAWPYPIDWVKELPAQKTVTVSTERLFEPIIPPENDTRGYLFPGADGYLMCLNEELGADENGERNSNGIVHAIGEVNYRITDAKKYYLSFYDDEDGKGTVTLDLGLNGKDGDANAVRAKKEDMRGNRGIIRLMLGNAMIAEAVSWRVEDLRNMMRVRDGRTENFEDGVKARLKRYIDAVDMGLEVQSVKVTIQLPAAVRREFEYVFSASEQSAAMIQQARQEADAIVKAAQNMAFRIVSEAESERDRVIADAEQDSKNFQNELEILRDMGSTSSYMETVLLTKYVDVLRAIYSRVENKILVKTTPGKDSKIRMRVNLPEKKKKKQNPAEAPVQQ
ncbi:MAG: hypothetical protein J6X55_10315 [Victivallales bacterium]|nr:hypothetical protein [Victivallales bacterium]